MSITGEVACPRRGTLERNAVAAVVAQHRLLLEMALVRPADLLDPVAGVLVVQRVEQDDDERLLLDRPGLAEPLPLAGELGQTIGKARGDRAVEEAVELRAVDRRALWPVGAEVELGAGIKRADRLRRSSGGRELGMVAAGVDAPARLTLTA